MQLDNASPFAAQVQVADPGTVDLFGGVIVKSTFDLVGQELRVSQDAQPLVLDQLDTPFGMFHGELFIKKRGIDLAVLGTVRRKSPVTHARLHLSCGRLRHELRVTGDRAWIPSRIRRGLEPSAPVPFTELPLGYHRSFGGTADYNGLAAGYPENPIGIGYYLNEAQAEGGRIANIEPADGPLVQNWEQRGKVVGWGPYPMFWALRGAKSVTVNAEKHWIEHVDPALFNHAHPELVLDRLDIATPITVEGLRPEPLRFVVPPPPAKIELRIGDRTQILPAPIDGVFVWADAEKVVITQRARFSYAYREEELRKVTVYQGDV